MSGFDDVNRLEIIDYTKPTEDGGGRSLVVWIPDGSLRISYDLQDKSRTLKIFVEKNEV